MRVYSVLTVLIVLGAAGIAGCHHAPDRPDPPCDALCQDQQAESNIRRTLGAEGLRGIPMAQIARDREALEREWCITKAMRLTAHDQMVSAMKECRELWPDQADTTIRVQ